MKEVKVLGTGCTKCIKTVEIISKIADELNVEVQISKVTDPETIMGYGVMTTPVIIINDVNVHSGSIPHRNEIETWLRDD
ncbi:MULTISPECIES: thioredoxin family protein [unclassified Colwellia]|jgi:small redox-active disulfide protein 2|uniref:thioredoxin family protein n=1 Tax=unclassified Colwellia TaxID=196834 RepID=UPI0015F3B2E4|nr:MULTISPECIES: thioredoxin family protein [unclassified Colwellia]MBA6233806.1 thioredoxin family protein [Colwellia sp. MB02u-7]MBA6237378.1 thioredoxin family protein [Colwellia sp. MB02u-11]MBA6256509.1 thioredoxin family protein [Colwellia sp. MB3u-28]MBA6260288.1 thioredoxin family protein [Colwellia sp. MB3u-41]MBA6300378.1 thioredoxin family protein [Colwellia sp. MB3u-22]